MVQARVNIDTLRALANQLRQQGQLSQAAAVHEQILKLDQADIQSLNYLGMLAFQKGDLDKSVQLFSEAVAAGASTHVHRNLGIALHQLGRFPEALETFQDGIEQKPEDAMAYLYAGSVLEAMGEAEEAAGAYSLALDLNPELRATHKDERAAPALRELAQRAIRVTNRLFSRIFEEAAGRMRERFDPESLQAFEKMVAVQLRKAEPEYASELQQPFEQYLPMNPKPWFERTEFEWAPMLEQSFDSLREEFTQLPSEDKSTLRPYIAGDNGEKIWEDFFGSYQWSSLHLWLKGAKTEAAERYPKTTALMEQIPLIYCDGRCPEVFFSILKPGIHLPPHYGQANYKLTAHYPIVVPEKCVIKVAHEERQWKPGELLVFDDTFLHEAWNNSDRDRIVLIFEIWNPQVSKVEQEAIQEVYRAVKTWLDHRKELVLQRRRHDGGLD